jgi:hypothetical protein
VTTVLHGIARSQIRLTSLQKYSSFKSLEGWRQALKFVSKDQRLALRVPTASAAVGRMAEAGILRESSGKRRGRLFVYESYLNMLNRES